MRRALASVLLALFAISMIAPALLADSVAPSCCRRDGKHHCSMDDGPSSGVVWKASAVCPIFGKVGVGSGLAGFSVSAVRIAATLEFSSPLRETRTAAIGAFPGSSALKRGPPALL